MARILLDLTGTTESILPYLQLTRKGRCVHVPLCLRVVIFGISLARAAFRCWRPGEGPAFRKILPNSESLNAVDCQSLTVVSFAFLKHSVHKHKSCPVVPTQYQIELTVLNTSNATHYKQIRNKNVFRLEWLHVRSIWTSISWERIVDCRYWCCNCSIIRFGQQLDLRVAIKRLFVCVIASITVILHVLGEPKPNLTHYYCWAQIINANPGTLIDLNYILIRRLMTVLRNLSETILYSELFWYFAEPQPAGVVEAEQMSEKDLRDASPLIDAFDITLVYIFSTNCWIIW